MANIIFNYWWYTLYREENTFSIFGVNNITDIDSPGYEIMTSAEYYSYPNKGELSFAPGLLVLPKPIAFSGIFQ